MIKNENMSYPKLFTIFSETGGGGLECYIIENKLLYRVI